jgi:hypothetical protein
VILASFKTQRFWRLHEEELEEINDANFDAANREGSPVCASSP